MSDDKNRKALLDYLGEFVTPHKKELFDKILASRTRYLTVVLEDIFQTHNASAVVRSCDCFGIQDLHVIENTNKYEVNPDVTLGSSKWVDIHRYQNAEDNTRDCLTALKEKGYCLVATTPDPSAESVFRYELKGPVALLFGTELTGLTEQAFDMADHRVRIPMYGFTESYNISVSVALCLQVFRDKMESLGNGTLMNSTEQDEIRIGWYRKVIKRVDQYIADFEKKWDKENS